MIGRSRWTNPAPEFFYDLVCLSNIDCVRVRSPCTGFVSRYCGLHWISVPCVPVDCDRRSRKGEYYCPCHEAARKFRPWEYASKALCSVGVKLMGRLAGGIHLHLADGSGVIPHLHGKERIKRYKEETAIFLGLTMIVLFKKIAEHIDLLRAKHGKVEPVIKIHIPFI